LSSYKNLEQAEMDLKLQTFLSSHSQMWIKQISYFANNIRNSRKVV